MIKFRFRRGSILSVGLLSGATFIALAVFGWDFPVETVLAYLAISVGFLLLIVLAALLVVAVFKYIFRR